MNRTKAFVMKQLTPSIPAAGEDGKENVSCLKAKLQRDEEEEKLKIFSFETRTF